MFLGDTHTHSVCSPDGENTIGELARAVGAAGLTHLTVTDHWDLLSLEGAPTPHHDWAPYEAAFSDALADLPQGLELCRGVELGGAIEDPAAARAILALAPGLDFVIGSVHNFHRIMGKMDFYFADYGDKAACLHALDDYLDALGETAALTDCYDVLGHVIYPLRYMNKEGRMVSLEEDGYFPRLESVLRRVAQAGKGIEVNTWRGRSVAEWTPILKLFKKVGGELVTVGSDAHRVSDVGKGVREAYQLMKDCGFDYVAVFLGRKARMERL